MTDPERWRSRALRGMEAYFRKRGFPRFMLGIILLFTGLAGFWISFGLLRAGMGDMWLRYPLAVLGAYGVFLLLMRGWVEVERLDFDPNDPELLAALETDQPQPVLTDHQKGKGSWLDWLDLPSGFGGDDGCAVGLGVLALIGAVVGLIALVLAVLSAAPALIAEVFVDAVLVGVLYRRLKIAAREHWLGTCIRKTWLFVVGTAILLFFAGMYLTVSAPGAKTIGQALEQMFPREG